MERLQTRVVLAPGEPVRPEAASAPCVPPTTTATDDEVFALVYRQIRQLAGRRDVDELAQVAAEQAIRGLSGFAAQSALSTWTFRICYLTVRKHDRWYRRWLRRFVLTDDGELPEQAAEREAAADNRLVSGERAARLRAALSMLSPKRRAVVVLYDLEGCSVEEIAAIVDAHPRAVRLRLRDGRKALAQILARDPYFGVEACRGSGES